MCHLIWCLYGKLKVAEFTWSDICMENWISSCIINNNKSTQSYIVLTIYMSLIINDIITHSFWKWYHTINFPIMPPLGLTLFNTYILCVCSTWRIKSDTDMHRRRKLLKIRGATLLNWSDFLLQKLHSYGEALNLKGVMAPWPPYFFHLCRHVKTL